MSSRIEGIEGLNEIRRLLERTHGAVDRTKGTFDPSTERIFTQGRFLHQDTPGKQDAPGKTEAASAKEERDNKAEFDWWRQFFQTIDRIWKS